MVFYLVIVIFSIAIHELAHLIVALKFKVKVYTYSLGFGKPLFKKRWKNIDWCITPFLLGGYCKVEEDPNKSNSLFQIVYWKQASILLAGVVCNLLIALLCYLLQYQSITKGLWIDLSLIKYMFTSDYINMANLVVNNNVNLYITQISLLNLALFLGNIIPIPPLDGGYLWLLPLEKSISKKLQTFIIVFGLIFIILLNIYLIFLLYGDLFNILYSNVDRLLRSIHTYLRP